MADGVNRLALIWDLIITFFRIGAFSFGGGYAMLPLMENEVIEIRGWLTNAEFIDIIAIAEMTPGPIAINSATFVGYRVANTFGSVIATLGVVLPSLIVMLTILIFINRFRSSQYVEWIFNGIRPVVLGLIASAAVSIGLSSIIDFKSVIITLGIFYLVAIRKVNPIKAILIAGVLGILLY